MPGFFVASVVLASGVFRAQDAKVNLQIRAAAAPLVVDQIAKQTGLKLAAEKNMWREYLCVAVKDVSSEDLLAKIAAACQAKWVVVEGVKTLYPDYDLRQRLVSSAMSRRVAGFTKSIKTFIDSLDPKPPKKDPAAKPAKPGDDDDEPMEYPPAGSGRRLLASYVAALGPSYFARLQQDSRVVMSSAPTRMQVQLPNVNVGPLLTKWVGEHNDMVKAMAQAGSEETEATSAEQEEMLKIMKDLGLERNYEQPKAIDAMPAKLLLIVSTQTFYGGQASCSAELRAFDRAGKMVLQEEASLSEVDYAAMGEAMVAAAGEDISQLEVPNKPEPPKETTKTPLVLGEAGKLWGKTHRRNFNPQNKKAEDEKPTEEELSRVGDFVTNEPLAGAPSDYFFALADKEHVNVVAVIPDDFISRAGLSMQEDRLTLENIGRMVFGDPNRPRSSYMEAAKSAGWWSVTPTDPEQTRKNRLDRTVLTKTVKSYRANQWMTLDSYAEFIASLPENTSSIAQEWTWPVLETRAFGGVFGGMGAENEWMRIWGLLDPGNRAALRRGVDVPFAGVSEAARREIAKKLFGPSAMMVTFPKPKGENELQIMNSLMLGMANGLESGQDLAEEPTEALPNGLDMRGRLLSSPFLEDYVVMSSNDTPGFLDSTALGIEELAFFDIITHMPGVPQEAESLASAKMKSGKRTTLRLRAEVVPNRGFQGMLMDPQKPGGAEFTAANMPQDMRAAVERKKELIKNSPLMKFISFGIGRMGQGEAPPPPLR